ncbi:DUF4124 domain-containing protein [Reinekea marinisedimentorum]|uniref:Uncharacterized protein DUF4124 n=1 Tax=Reinekea marinisedimentorum TaxID=230495 RepID=A0A4R3I9P2_9GAMM|nr:DUF4124 domain-containing protein [Reinekea marinisedimentorum]TCS43128.1 uncharacterized protein DUF4124 [Reinekea marinisedimentorum]
MKRYLPAIMASVLACFVNAETTIYHWVDAEGNDHFSNVPAPEAENDVVDVSHINLYTDTTETSSEQPSGQNQQTSMNRSNSQQQGQPPMQQGGGMSESGSETEGMMPPPPDMMER